jgi:hypothetical protein
MALEPISIVNRACARIGIDPIESFADEFAGTKAGQIYDALVEFSLGVYGFSWGQKMVALSRLSAVSQLGYDYVYQLPGDRLGPPLRISDDAAAVHPDFARYTLSADQVHADAEALYALIKFKPDPALWSSSFAEAVTLALAGDLAFMFADDATTRAQFREDAFGAPQEEYRGGAMGAAIKEDARATPPRRLPQGRDPFSMAHNGAWR